MPKKIRCYRFRRKGNCSTTLQDYSGNKEKIDPNKKNLIVADYKTDPVFSVVFDVLKIVTIVTYTSQGPAMYNSENKGKVAACLSNFVDNF